MMCSESEIDGVSQEPYHNKGAPFGGWQLYTGPLIQKKGKGHHWATRVEANVEATLNPKP